MEVGLKIKLMRVRKGLTQDELSRLSGVNIATIVGIETGRRKPQGNTLMKLNNVLTDGDDEKLSELLKTNNWKEKGKNETLPKNQWNSCKN